MADLWLTARRDTSQRSLSLIGRHRAVLAWLTFMFSSTFACKTRQVRGWAERCEHETKEHKEFFLVAPAHLRRTSHDGLMTRRSIVQVRSPKSHILAFYGGRSAPTRALSPSVRLRTAMWTAGLQ